MYEMNDALAVAVAFENEIVTEHYHKEYYIEKQGRFTKSMVVVNWFDEQIDQEVQDGPASTKRHRVHIVTGVDVTKTMQLFIDCV